MLDELNYELRSREISAGKLVLTLRSGAADDVLKEGVLRGHKTSSPPWHLEEPEAFCSRPHVGDPLLLFLRPHAGCPVAYRPIVRIKR